MAEITKVSDITTDYLVGYLRIDEPEQSERDEIATFLKSAKSYVSSYTGLPETAGENDTLGDLDGNPDFIMAVCVLVQNQYDNRTFYTDKGKVEDVIASVLGLHRVNLL